MESQCRTICVCGNVTCVETLHFEPDGKLNSPGKEDLVRTNTHNPDDRDVGAGDQGIMLGALSVDVKLDETDHEKKQFSKLKNIHQPLADWWTEELNDQTVGVKIEGVVIST